MKKCTIFSTAILFLASVFLFTGCNEYDDSNLKEQIEEIKEGMPQFSFVKSESENKDMIMIGFSETKTIQLNIKNVTNISILSRPEGDWDIKLDILNSKVIITSPKEGEAISMEGSLFLTGEDKQGNSLYTSIKLFASPNFTDPSGTFVMTEGNMTSANGTLFFYDKNGKEYSEIFERANGGLEIGNVCQDMYIANNKIYLITQNGNNMGGAGRFVVCDLSTMKMIYSNPLIIKTPENKATWPQHLVVVNDSVAYVQYSEAGMEATSGICKLKLTNNTVTVGETIDGTFGKFTTVGAVKTRMVYSREKLYAGCGHSVVIINPTNDSKVEKSVSFEGRQVKGVVKAADGNIYIALTGTFTGNFQSPTFTSDPKIVGINHAGEIILEQELKGIRFPTASWSPAIGICADFIEPYLYFVDSDAFSATTASRYNYNTKSLEKGFISGSETIYGIMGVNPITKKLWVGKSSYVDSNIYVYNVTGASAVEEHKFYYSTQKGASPAGVDFTYRFTKEFINK